MCKILKDSGVIVLVALWTAGLIFSGCRINTGEDEKITRYTRVLEKDPDNTEALYSRGNAYSAKMDYEEAIKDYNRALSINPGLTKVYLNRGSAYTKLRFII